MVQKKKDEQYKVDYKYLKNIHNVLEEELVFGDEKVDEFRSLCNLQLRNSYETEGDRIY